MPWRVGGRLTDFSGLLHVESVRHEGQVWVHEADEIRDSLLKGVSWVEDKLDPAV